MSRQYLDAMTASGHHFVTDAEECVRVMMVPVDDEKDTGTRSCS